MAHTRVIAPWRSLLPVTGFILCILLGAPVSHAKSLLQSGPEQVSLLELYTSQGCSSCPPADQWMSRLKDDPGLWNKVVPLSFHVDYWDYIGWRDPFAQPEFGQRQRHYARQGGVRTVYTPAMLLNGNEWRGWRDEDFPGGRPDSAGILTLELGEQNMTIRFLPNKQDSKGLRVYLALLGFDQISDVTAGENRGRQLSSDFIVLALIQEPLRREQELYFSSVPLFVQDRQFSRLAISAWVAERDSLVPLQAVGGWLNSTDTR